MDLGHWRLGYWCLIRPNRLLAPVISAFCLAAQSNTPQPETWNVYFQATSVGQFHPSFPSPYMGPLSLVGYPEKDVSLTSTLFLGWRWRNTQVYFDPEVAGGRGFSGTNGIANFSNGEITRVAATAPSSHWRALATTRR